MKPIGMEFGKHIIGASYAARSILNYLLDLKNKDVTIFNALPSIKWYLSKTNDYDYDNLCFIRILIDAGDLEGAIDIAMDDLIYDLGGV